MIGRHRSAAVPGLFLAGIATPPSELWILIPLVLLFGLAAWWRFQDRDIRKGRVLFSLLLLATLFCSLWPQGMRPFLEPKSPQIQAVIVDLSRSRGFDVWSREHAASFAAEDADRLMVIAAGRQPHLVYDGSPDSFEPGALDESHTSLDNTAAFDLAAALRLLQEKVTEGSDLDLRIASDGGFERVEAERELRALKVRSLQLELAAGARPAPDNLSLAAITRVLVVPAMGDPIASSVDVELYGDVLQPLKVEVVLEGGGKQSVSFAPGEGSVFVSVTVPATLFDQPVISVYLSGHETRDPDRRLERIQIPVRRPVPGRRLTLLGEGADDLVAMLKRRGFEVARGSQFLLDADAALLVDVDAPTAEARGWDAVLAAYAALGGTVVLGGDQNAFGLGAWSRTKLEEISPLLADPGDGPQHVTVALDRSGSMARDGRFRAAARALEALAGQLRDRDGLQLLTFADESSSRFYESKDRSALSRDLRRVIVRGGTNLALAMDEALAVTRPPDASSSLFLLSDVRDEALAKNPAKWKEWLEKARAQKLRVFVFWFDREESVRPRLEELVRESGGELVEVDDFESLTRAFLSRARKDLVVGPLDLPQVAGGEKVTLPRLLRTRARPGARVLSGAGKDRIALATHFYKQGLVAAMPAAFSAERLTQLFGNVDRFVGWLSSLIEKGGVRDGRVWSLSAVPESWGYRWDLRLASNQPGETKEQSQPAFLVSGDQRFPLQRRGFAHFVSDVIDPETALAPKDPAGSWLQLLDLDGRPLGQIVRPRLPLGDRHQTPDRASQADFLRKIKDGIDPSPLRSFPYGLLGLALLGFCADLLFRARGR